MYVCHARNGEDKYRRGRIFGSELRQRCEATSTIILEASLILQRKTVPFS